jgi:hypothetical protein
MGNEVAQVEINLIRIKKLGETISKRWDDIHIWILVSALWV